MPRINYIPKTDAQYMDLYERLKDYFDAGGVTALDEMNLTNQFQLAFYEHRGVKKADNPKPLEVIGTRSRLVDTWFNKPQIAQKIRQDLMAKHIRETKIGDMKRYQLAKGTPSFVYMGKIRRAGQFIKGRGFDEALANLEEQTR